jgi:hypothetical protein
MTPDRLKRLNFLNDEIQETTGVLSQLNGDIPPDFERMYHCTPESAAAVLLILRNDLTMQLDHAMQEFAAS